MSGMIIKNFKGIKKMSAVITYINHLAAKNIIIRLYKYYIIDSIIIVKSKGLKALFKKRGWKFFAIIIGYYAVRDTVVYVLVPLLIAQGIF